MNVFTDDVSEHIRRTGIPLGPSSEQALDISSKFSVFSTADLKRRILNPPVFTIALLFL